MCTSTPSPQHPRKLHNFTQPPLILCGPHGAVLPVPSLVGTGMHVHLFFLTPLASDELWSPSSTAAGLATPLSP